VETLYGLHELQRRTGKLITRYLKWSFKWRKELVSGQYYDLLNRGFIKDHDAEPGIFGMDFYFDAFRELSTSRPVGMEIQHIPFTAIAEYFRIYELQDFDEFLYIIRCMDNTLLELNASKTRVEVGDRNGAANTSKTNRNKS
jgi:hypothetical protein